jgi:rhodanese-related sulfurtransferase
MSDSLSLHALTVKQTIEELGQNTLVLDIRGVEQFALFHIRGSIQISLAGSFASWSAILIEPTRSVLLVSEHPNDAEEARGRLDRVGIKHVIGYILANAQQWNREGLPVASLKTRRSTDFVQRPELRRSMRFVDIRSRAEWLRGHVEGAVSVPLQELASLPDHYPPERTLIYCKEGYRAVTAASILRREDHEEIEVLIDGVDGWLTSGLSLSADESEVDRVA